VRDIALALPLEETQQGVAAQYVIWMPYLPLSKNQWDYKDPINRGRIKKRWIQRIVKECEIQDMPKGLPKIALGAVLYFGTNRQRDPQNYVSALWNIVPDALEAKQHGSVKRGKDLVPLFGYGLIPDDRDGRIIYPGGLGIVLTVDRARMGQTKLIIAARS
jgi:hypothetical protein